MDKIDYSRYYRKWHKTDEDYVEKRIKFYKRYVKRFLPGDQKIKILDIGCGMGFLLVALNRMGYKNCMGIDISIEQIDVAQGFGLNVSHVEDSLDFLKNNEESFDVILAFDVIEHIPINDQLSFIKAICNALKSDGKFVCTVPNANSILASRWRYGDWTHFCSFTENSLDFLLYNGGFKNITIGNDELRPRYIWLPRFNSILWFYRKFMRGLYRLQLMAEMDPFEAWQIPLSVNLLGVAKK